MTVWERRDLPVLRALATSDDDHVRSGYLHRSPFTIKSISRWVPWSPPAGKRHLSRAELAALLDGAHLTIGQFGADEPRCVLAKAPAERALIEVARRLQIISVDGEMRELSHD